MASLYLVATPIGNREDITLRALRVLSEVKLIAAEDTRKTRQLLDAYGIKTPVTSYHEHNKQAKLSYLLNHLGKHDVALVSEAGTPGISDPGYELVVAAAERGIPIVAIPGASIIATALVISGLPTDQFVYLGFLPRKKAQRRHLLQDVAPGLRTIIALEAPHRLRAALADILEVLGDRRIAVCREITKLHEEVFRGTVSQALEHFEQPRGEFTLVIEGKQREEKTALTEDVDKELRRLFQEGLTARETVAELSRTTQIPKRELYQAWLKIAKATPRNQDEIAC